MHARSGQPVFAVRPFREVPFMLTRLCARRRYQMPKKITSAAFSTTKNALTETRKKYSTSTADSAPASAHVVEHEHLAFGRRVLRPPHEAGAVRVARLHELHSLRETALAH